MKEEKGNIFTLFDEILDRAGKEELLDQKASVIWMSGLSGSGKSTIANALERRLHTDGLLCKMLDGDNIRAGINKDLGFSGSDRKENIRRIAEVARLFLDCGVITICCFVSPTKEIRALAKEIIGEDDLIEVYVDTPLEVCEERDVKGLYKKARAGVIPDFTGISAPFEAPEDADVVLRTVGKSVEESVEELYALISDRVKPDS